MIGIIGGTGLYKMDGLTNIRSEEVKTPYGSPSSPITLGNIGESKIAFLPRHGSGHGLLPSEINFRANIWALKSVGVREVISVSAVGSLSQEIKPGDLAVPNQYLDFTKGRREHTFFGGGLVAHISTAEPSCANLSARIRKESKALNITLHSEKTYACVEGPRLGNKAESHFLRRNEAHIVGMTNVPEVYLAREAQMCYCTIAVVTDYDCWLEDPSQHATADKVVALYMNNIGRVQSILRSVSQASSAGQACGCRKSLQGAVMSQEGNLSKEKKDLLEFLRQ